MRPTPLRDAHYFAAEHSQPSPQPQDAVQVHSAHVQRSAVDFAQPHDAFEQRHAFPFFFPMVFVS